ncbi:transporter [Stappia taiwanensis]|uniref:Transporter n=1 Tax=Stappia taiwanensis TaxID=992267 RepID=A0A838XIN7_9HYPH|nr:OmpP1/FadL family transporter [Stappia taiwanensis]MBA4610405.1 transporter [Stappia taiwanensis]GGE85248.1 aromatic hydrocarbon degradation protein [Stappia taiwanensis]
MTNRIKNALLAVSALTAVGIATEASAGGFALREQSSYYQGMSFAGYGTTGPSISSIFWNPATITGAPDGLTFEAHNTLLMPTAKMDGTFTSSGVALPPFGIVLPNSSAPSGDIANDAYIPASYTAYKVTDQVFFGVAINAPFGLSTKPNDNWAGQFYSRSSKAASLNVTPMIGYKFNEMLSFAFGLQIQQFAVSLKTGVPNVPGFPTAALEGDDIGFGVTAGVTLKPIAGTEIGLGYRSGVAHQLGGTVSSPSGIAPITANLITPDMVNLSVKQRVTDAFRVLGTVEWTNWSRLKTPRAVMPNGTVAKALPFNYSDGWYFSIGGEYDFNEDLTLRAGIGYELSPIDTDIRSTRLPDNDRLWLSAGASYQVMDNLAMDFGYTYIRTADTRVNIGPGHQDYVPALGTYSSNVDANVNIVSASLRYTWGGPVERPELDPIRKY